MSVRYLTLLLLGAACTHSEPFEAPDDALEGPLVGGEPLQLTYADGGPSAPAWIPGGDTIIYAYPRRGGGFSVNEEGCLAVLPSEGGTIRREICSRSVFATQAEDRFSLPSVSAERRLAFMHIGQATAGDAVREAILAAALDTPSAYTIVRSFPFQGDAFYLAAEDVQWLGESRIVLLGVAEEELPRPCPTCDPVIVRYPRAVLLADAGGSGATTLVPGTMLATSVSAGESEDVIYYTLAGDSRIYRQVLSTGQVMVAHDFGTSIVARGVHYAAGRIVAMIDGRYAIAEDEIGTLHTSESGGMLQVVTPGAGAAQAVVTATPMWFRRPALSADGRVIVAEGERLALNAIRNSVGTIIAYDTVPGPTSIWRIAAP